MTKEEAIKGLKVLCRDFSGYKPNEEMFDIAIQALEQEQQRQEDIYECQHCLGEVHKNYIYCPFCGKRIEALEQEETLQNLTKPNKSDLISRQAAIDALKEHRALYCDNTPETFSKLSYAEKSRVDELDAAIATLVNLPSAQLFTEEQIQTMQELEAAQIEKAYELGKADRPTGHWIEDEKQNVLMRKFIEKGEVWRVCSVCGAGLMIGAEYETDKYYHETFHNYCPNCGADMRGGPTLTPEEFAEKMAGIAENGDEERKHVAADSIMCELLKSLGFGEGVGIFEDMDKWYS